MQAQHSHMEYEQAAHIHERGLGDLQDAVSHYMPVLYKRAYRYVGDPHDAEDAVQDALLSAYTHLHQFKGTAKMTTWLTTIVTNSALTKLRRRPRHSHVSLDEHLTGEQDYHFSDRLADVRPSPEGECIRSEMEGKLMRSVMELSPLLREAIQLCDLEGRSTSEVAHSLGVPCGTMKSRVSRARLRLNQLMRRK